MGLPCTRATNLTGKWENEISGKPLKGVLGRPTNPRDFSNALPSNAKLLPEATLHLTARHSRSLWDLWVCPIRLSMACRIFHSPTCLSSWWLEYTASPFNARQRLL